MTSLQQKKPVIWNFSFDVQLKSQTWSSKLELKKKKKTQIQHSLSPETEFKPTTGE